VTGVQGFWIVRIRRDLGLPIAIGVWLPRTDRSQFPQPYFCRKQGSFFCLKNLCLAENQTFRMHESELKPLCLVKNQQDNPIATQQMANTLQRYLPII
jgi:hypothetical protein